MNRQRIELARRILMESASKLQNYLDNHLVPESHHKMLDGEDWQEVVDELERAAEIMQEHASSIE